MELAHGGFPADYAGNIKLELVNALFQIYEDDIGEHLKSVPTAVNDDLGSVPELAGVSHSGLWQLVFVYFWLEPVLLLRVEYEDIVDNALLSVTLASAKNQQKLPKLSRRVTVPRRGRRTLNLLNFKCGLIAYFDHVPSELDHLECLVR